MASDNFNRANGAPGANWAQVFSGFSVPPIASNRLSWPQYPSLYWTSLFGPDQYVSIGMQAGIGGSLLLRLTSPNTGSETCYRINFQLGSPYSAEALKIVAGAQTTLGYFNFTMDPADTWVKASVVGNLISLYGSSDGVTWALRRTWTDSSISGAGYVGLASANNGAGPYGSLDDFEANSITSYSLVPWVDGVTPENAANLGHMDQGIMDAHVRLPPPIAGQNGNWLQVSGGAMVWQPFPGILASLLDAKGDLIGASADNTPVRIPAPTVDGYVLTALASATPGATWAAPAAGYTPPWSSKVAPVDAQNAATEFDICNISVPGGTLGTDKTIQLLLGGDTLYNSAQTATLTLRLYYGTTVIWAAATVGVALGATRVPWVLDLLLFGSGATNAQTCAGMIVAANPAALVGVTTGIGTIGFLHPASGIQNQVPSGAVIGGTAAEDSTAAKVLRFTAQWSGTGGTSVNNSFRSRGGAARALTT